MAVLHRNKTALNVMNANVHANVLSMISYNMHGFNQGSNLISYFCYDLHVDIILIQEHWLTPDNMHKIAKYSKHYSCVGISAMEMAVNRSILRGRPYGGSCILYRTDLSSGVSFQTCSERMSAIVYNDLLIINVYCNKIINDAERCNVISLLEEVQEVIAMFPTLTIVWGGDFNIDLGKPSIDQDMFITFFRSHALVTCNSIIDSNLNYTYCHQSLDHYSYIDYFVISESSILVDFKILDLALNLSDHNPVYIQINVNDCNNITKLVPRESTFGTVNKLRWDYANLQSYSERCCELLQPLYDQVCIVYSEYMDYDSFTNHGTLNSNVTAYTQLEHVDNTYCCYDDVKSNNYSVVTNCIDKTYSELVLALNNAANHSVPQDKCCFRKYWWNQELNELKEQNIQAHNVWLSAGKPKFGNIYDRKSKCKAAYRNCIRSSKKRESTQISESLQTALSNKTQTTFWNIWRKNFGAKTTQSNLIIDDKTDNLEVANTFADMFANICKPNSEKLNNESETQFKDQFKNYKGGTLSNGKELTSMEELEFIISSLKFGKATGLDNLSAEHLKHAHPIVWSILVKLLNLMWQFSHIPAAFGQGLTVPIPKITLHKNKAKSEDFRGITINPIISKILEHCLTNRLRQWLVSSDNQFGFKKGYGCNHAIFTAQATIDYFVSNQSTVNVCALDLSKAFDKVNHYILYLKLMNKNVPINFIKILLFWYSSSSIVIKWQSVLSYSVKLQAGVRQGGVLSPILFACYVDDVLRKMNSSGFGCHINHLCYNAIMYADDILLMSVSVRDLQEMVNICLNELSLIDMIINVKKSVCIRVGKRHNANVANIMIHGDPIEWKQELKYLGLQFVSASRLKCNLQILRQKFFRATNGIFGKIGTRASLSCYSTLINSYCTPLLTYGMEAITLSKSDLNSIKSAYMTSWGKIIGSFNCNIMYNCLFFCGILPVEYCIDLRKLTFLDQMANSPNVGLLHLFRINGNATFQHLLSKYNLGITESWNCWKSKIWSMFQQTLQ